MKASITSARRKTLWKPIAPLLLMVALIFPLTMTEGQQRRRQKQQRANQQTQTSPQSSAAQQSSTDPAQRTGRRGRRGRADATNASDTTQSSAAQQGSADQNQRLGRRGRADATNASDTTQSSAAQESSTDQNQRIGRRGRADATNASDTTQTSAAQESSTDQNQRMGRRGRRGALGSTSSSSTTSQGQQSQASKPKVTVVRRVNQAQLSTATIRTLSSIAYLRGVFTVRANTISPGTGSSLWLLSNGGYALIGGGTVEPLPSETWTKNMGGGDVYACSCSCENNNADDGCEFVGAGDTQYNPQNCRGGVNCTCKFRDGVVLGNGKSIPFQGPM